MYKRQVLGLEGYTKIIKKLNTDTPIIAIGGITIKDVQELIETGIYGIAVSRAITENFNAISTFNKQLNAPSTKEQLWIPNDQ